MHTATPPCSNARARGTHQGYTHTAANPYSPASRQSAKRRVSCTWVEQRVVNGSGNVLDG